MQQATSGVLAEDPIGLARRHWNDAGWRDAADGMALVTSVMRVQQLLQARVEAVLRPYGLTFARFEVLMLLRFSSRGMLPIGKIGERLQVHPASVTNAVHRLVEAGLVERTANPRDARSVIVSLTAEGTRRAEAGAVALNEQVFADVGLPSDDQATVLAHLAEWRRAHGDFHHD